MRESGRKHFTLWKDADPEMAEVVDARDLKSLGGYPTCRFESRLRQIKRICFSAFSPSTTVGKYK